MSVRVVAFLVLMNLVGKVWGQTIDPQVLAQVKDATVFVKFKVGRIQGSGTGFVIKATSDTVLIRSNRHVVAPDELPDGAKPEISVVFRSGTPDEQELPARVLAFDYREVRDLAVIEVQKVNKV